MAIQQPRKIKEKKERKKNVHERSSMNSLALHGPCK